MKINKKAIGVIAFAAISCTGAITTIDADSYTAKEGAHLKTAIVENVIDSTVNPTIEDMVNNQSLSLTKISNQTLKEEIRLQDEYQKQKEAEAAQREKEEAIAAAQAAEAQRQAEASIVVNKLNAKFRGSLTNMGQYFYNVCLEYGVDPYLAGAISLYETGYGTSNLAVNQNNVGGMRTSGGWMSFATIEEGISAYVRNLANNYMNYGLTTPETMVNKYAEGSSSWVNNVNTMYSYLLNA